MSTTVATPKKVSRVKRKPKAQVMTKFEMLQKMIADQKLIRDCIQNGMTPQEITAKYGFRFSSL